MTCRKGKAPLIFRRESLKDRYQKQRVEMVERKYSVKSNDYLALDILYFLVKRLEGSHLKR